MSEHPPVEPTDEITRRRWLLRLGEMVFLAGVSGLVPDTLWSQIETSEGAGLGSLPPGLYTPSADHLVHALQHSGKLLPIPPAVRSNSHCLRHFLIIRCSFQSMNIGWSRDSSRLFWEIWSLPLFPKSLDWLDLWLHSAGGVLEAARILDPSHRVLAAAYFGEASVRETETSNPQLIARAGLAALNDLSHAHHGKAFLKLAEPEQAHLVISSAADKPDSPLRRFFEVMRTEAIRGYYTSPEGLKDLDYKGNAYYPQCPGCISDRETE